LFSSSRFYALRSRLYRGSRRLPSRRRGRANGKLSKLRTGGVSGGISVCGAPRWRRAHAPPSLCRQPPEFQPAVPDRRHQQVLQLWRRLLRMRCQHRADLRMGRGGQLSRRVRPAPGYQKSGCV